MSSRRSMLHAVTRQLHFLLPTLRVTRTRGLALLVVGMLWSRSVALPRMAAALPLGATDASLERRLRRWLANAQVDVGTIWRTLLPRLLTDRAGQDLLLVFDPTPLGTRATVLVLGLVVRHRIVPLAWRTMPQQDGKWATSQGDLMVTLMQEVQAALPPACTVTLVADRQMSGVRILDACQALGWHVVVRLNGGAKRRIYWRADPEAAAQPVATLLTGPGQRWHARGQLFPTEQWRDVWLTIRWDRGHEEPWILVSDREGGPARVADYRRRARCEATYQDCKSRGFHMDRSRVRDLDRMDRVLLALHLAFWWATRLGLHVLRHGERRHYDRSDRRDLSILRLGLMVFSELDLGRPHVPLLFVRRHDTWYVPGMT